MFTKPPEGVTGDSINFDKIVGIKPYVKYAVIDEFNRDLYRQDYMHYCRNSPFEEMPQPDKKDFITQVTIEASIVFITGCQNPITWTKLEDKENTLKELYEDIISGRFPYKEL